MKSQKTSPGKSGEKGHKTHKTAPKKVSQPSEETTKEPGTQTESEFPGYPKYPANEDIMNTGNRLEGNLDDEALTGQSVDMSRVKNEGEALADKEMAEGVEDELKPLGKNPYDVTDDDLEALGPEDLSMDMGDDEQLKHRNRPVDFTGKDLDIPGSELDDEQEALGSEDEENNGYSIGGDNHDDLEESRE